MCAPQRYSSCKPSFNTQHLLPSEVRNMADNGSGNYGGNGSVWWQVVHGSNNQPDKHLKRVEQVDSGKNDEHWVKARASEDTVVGHDPVPLNQVGRGQKKGRFEVNLRYTTRQPFAGGGAAMRAVAIQELQELIQSALVALSTIATAPETAAVDVTVRGYVPIRQRQEDPPTTGVWEVTVDW